MFHYPNFPIINIWNFFCLNCLLNKKCQFTYSRSIKFESIKSLIVILSLVSFENSLIENSICIQLIIWVDDQHALSSLQMSLLNDKS